ncbi:MAG: hypothetical protein AB3N15_18030 [Paracoccaceae bacterium]
MIRFASVAVLMTALAACSAPPPENAGGATAPTASATQDGAFEVSDGSTRCSGRYDPADNAPTLQVPLRCEDGRTGTASITRQGDPTSGAGKVSLSDGTQWEFLFGRATELI